ncbi:MAG: hypothetical protein ACK58L_03605 [Planctomycetota bacterium]
MSMSAGAVNAGPFFDGPALQGESGVRCLISKDAINSGFECVGTCAVRFG